MAWISVDQKLIGGKLRSLYKSIGCSQNEAIGILVSLWLWGIDNADMAGLIVSADRSDIKAVIQTGLSDGIDGDKVVDSLIDTGWIDEEGGELYLHDWEDWRSYYNRYVREKEKQAARMRKYRGKKAEDNAKDNVTRDVYSDVTENIEQEEPEPPSQKESQESKYGKDFETFWEVYPRKADKGQAHKKYKARLKDGYSPAELLQAAEAYRAQCERNRTEQQYIKHAKTFLGDSLPFTEFIQVKQEPTRESGAGKNLEPGQNPFRRS